MEVIGKGPWRVWVVESERGWGQKIDHARRFESKEEANVWKIFFNSENNLPDVPDWYMYAEEPQYVP